LRWTVERGSREFKLAANTLRKFLNQSGAEPDGGGCYSTQQICECIYGDLRAEKLRKERELTKKYQLENAIVEASVLDRAALAQAFGQIATAISSRIMSAHELPRTVREDVLRDLSSWPLALADVAARQSRMPHDKRNGAEDDE
jgi:hypothetical protein